MLNVLCTERRLLSDIRIGRLAIELGFVEEDELQGALDEQDELEAAGSYRPLGQIMVRRRLVTRSQLRRLLRQQRLLAARVTRIGKYHLLSMRAEGGMGAIYRAQDMESGMPAALKVLPRSHARRRNLLERFRREALSGSLLDHPNIVKVLDADYADGYHYIAMEYVRGMSLAEMLTESGRLKEKDALSIGIQITRALEHIAERGLVHRDIKPGNILVDDDGVAKLADMGLALWVERPLPRLTVTGHTIGTPTYVSPEQAQGAEADIRSDIYALGSTLYEAVTGVPPFRGKSAADILARRILNEAPDPRHIERTLSDGVCYVIRKMLAKQPEERYQTPRELMKDMLVVYRGELPEALRAKPPAKPRPPTSLAEAEAFPGEVLPRERPTPIHVLDGRRLSTGRLLAGRPPVASPWPAALAGTAICGVLLLVGGVVLGKRLAAGHSRPPARNMQQVSLDFSRPLPGWRGGAYTAGGLMAVADPPILQMTATGFEIVKDTVFSLLLSVDAPALLFASLESQDGSVFTASVQIEKAAAVTVSFAPASFVNIANAETGLPAGRYSRLAIEARGAGSLLLQRLSIAPARLFVSEPY